MSYYLLNILVQLQENPNDGFFNVTILESTSRILQQNSLFVAWT